MLGSFSMSSYFSLDLPNVDFGWDSYPHALHHLELLQHSQFRAEMKQDGWRDYLNRKQFDHWRTWSVVLVL